MKKLTLIAFVLVAINGTSQTVTKKFNMDRNAGRKAAVDTTTNKQTNGKYNAYIYKEKQAKEEVRTKSLVLIDVQEYIKKANEKNDKVGLLLVQSSKSRLQGVVWATTCTVIGSVAFAASKGRSGGVVFGSITIGLGSVISIYKLVDSFNKIRQAGKLLRNL